MCKIYQNQKGKVKYNFAVHITLGGETRRVSLNTKDKAIAEQYKTPIDNFELQTRLDPDTTNYYWKKFYVLIGRQDLIEIDKHKNDPKFLEHFFQWIDTKYKMRLVSRKTWETYTLCNANLKAIFNENHYLSDFSQDKYDELYAFWIDQGYKPATISIRARILKAYFNWCIKRGILKVMPFPIDKVKIPKRSPKFLYPEQAILHYNVIIDNPRVENTLTQYYIQASRKANIKSKLHDLRHTYAFTQVAKGTPLFNLQMLMGHSKSDTTQIYLQTDPDMLMDLIDKNHNLVDGYGVVA